MKRFTLTEDHIKLLRRAMVGLGIRAYSSAPAIDDKYPFGGSNWQQQMHEICGWPFPKDDGEQETYFEDKGNKRACDMMQSLHVALQIVLATGSFQPGDYVAPAYTDLWARLPEEETAPWSWARIIRASFDVELPSWWQFMSKSRVHPAVDEVIAVREVEPLKCDDGYRPVQGAQWRKCKVLHKLPCDTYGTLYILEEVP